MKRLLIATFILAAVLAPVSGKSARMAEQPDFIILDETHMYTVANHYTGANSVLVEVLNTSDNVVASATVRCGGTATFPISNTYKSVRYTYHYDNDFIVITDTVVY